MLVWQDLRAVVLDMDGVVFIGQQLRLGVREFIARLQGAGIDYHILTNTSAYTSEQIAANLARMGLDVEASKITTSSEVVASYVATSDGNGRVFTLGGGEGLAVALRARGIEQLALEGLPIQDVLHLANDEPICSRPLILGWTRHYDFELATKALRLEKCISNIYSTGSDRLYADEAGASPAIRWLSGSIEALLDKHAFNPAKPNRYALDYVLQKLGQPAAMTAMIGDSISDVQIGKECGCRTVLVLGGATSRAQLEAAPAVVPWLIVEELTQLL